MAHGLACSHSAVLLRKLPTMYFYSKKPCFLFYKRGNTAHQSQVPCTTIRHLLFQVLEKPSFDPGRETLSRSCGPELSWPLLSACAQTPGLQETPFPRPIALRSEFLQKAKVLSPCSGALAVPKGEATALRIRGRGTKR